MGCYDSNADEEHLPNELTSSDTDGDEQTPVAGLRKPSKCKVRIDKNAAKPIQNQNSDSTNENGIHLRSEESLSVSDNSDSNNIDGEGSVVEQNVMGRPNKRKVKNKLEESGCLTKKGGCAM